MVKLETILFLFMWPVMLFYLLTKDLIVICYILSIAIYLVAVKLFAYLKIEKHIIVVVIMLWLNLIGDSYLYTNFQYYDKFLHLVIPFCVGYLICGFATNKYIAFLSSMGLFALFEVYEWIVQSVFGISLLGVYSGGNMIMSEIDDTIIDLIFGGFGSAVGICLKKK